MELTEAEAAVWAAAFIDPESHAKLAVNRASLIRLLETAPKPERRAAEIVDDLLKRGLLVEFDPDGDLEPVFHRHKLLPLGQGLGSTPEEPHLHRIGFAGKAAVALPIQVFTQWSYAYLHADLWEACVFYADESEDAEEGEELLNLTPEEVARDTALNLPMMISTSTAFLDPVVES
ncbi:hypothetical protein ACFQ4H_11260 [Micromonospora sonneratiae]|uniref:Uncharacterized protein n=1 Tax=Micromonospora sonneratiae TaxID=1184706 RepID=A0ABW3YDZ8_9ACTN